MSGGKYLIGDYDTDRNKFVVTNGGHFNHGPVNPGGLPAPSAFPDGAGGVFCIFNMNPGINQRDSKRDQLMTMPIHLTVDENDYLHISPAGDYELLRRDHESIIDMTLPANKEIVFENINGSALEIKAAIDPKQANCVELNVLRSPNKEEYTRIMFYRNRGYSRNYSHERRTLQRNSAISPDNSHSSLLPDIYSRAPETADILIEKDELVELHIFIDKSIVEVFVNGRQFIAERVYPSLDESVGVSVCARGQAATLISLDAWQMENIYY